jgi:putative membrane protein
MSTNQFNKPSLLFGFLLLSLMSFVSCENKPKDSKEAAQEINKPNSDYTKESDERFLVRAAEINLEEIQLGQLAQQRGTLAEVKELGRMMEQAHSKANDDLHALASRKGIAVPMTATEDSRDTYNKMSEKTGNDFDRDYCDKMVKGHKDAIDLYENATKGNNDPDIKTWASNMLPDLRQHLASSQSCEDKLKQLADKTN